MIKRSTSTKTNSMFVIKNKNGAVQVLLEYINKPYERSTGLCGYTRYTSAYYFIKEEIRKIKKGKKSLFWEDFPVECSILSAEKKCLHGPAGAMYHSVRKSDNRHPSMKLRIWWAYNMAVALSNQQP